MSAKAEKFSVVIPVYRAENYLSIFDFSFC